MIRALVLGLGDLADRRIIGILVRSLLVTLSIFVAIGGGLTWLLRGADPCEWIGLDACPLDGSASGVGAVVLAAIGAWLLFPPVAIGVVSAFADEIVAAVEARHYPAAARTARRVGAARGALLGLRGSLTQLFYNLLALPLYLVLLVTGIGWIALAVIVNGLALGGDLGATVAIRHADGTLAGPGFGRRG